MSIDRDKYRDLFLSEAREHLAAFDDGLLRLERGADGDTVDALFRAAHSFKGMSATLGYDGESALAHAIEDHLDRLRAGRAIPDGLVDRLLDAVDALRANVDAIEAGDDPDGLVDRASELRAALKLHDAAAPADQAPASAAPQADLAALVAAYDAHDGPRRWVRLTLRDDAAAVKARLLVVSRTAGRLGQLLGTAPAKERWADIEPQADPVVHLALATEADVTTVAGRLGAVPDIASVDLEDGVPRSVRQLLAPAEATPAAEPAPTLQVRPSSTVRVPVERVDRLLDQTGELRIAQAQLARLLQDLYAGPRPYALLEALERIERESRTLYEAALDLRTLPVSLVTGRFPRLVRSVAKAEGKQVELVIEGEDTHIDRSVIEVLGEPVMHLVKNAIGHGVETPEARAAAGKPPLGRVAITFSRIAAGVRVEVHDDGRGISRRAVLDTALERGLIHEGDIAGLSDDDILLLLGAPGFSTATEVTDVSGRGVGLDAVKHDVEKLGGSIQIASDEGVGTTVAMTLPPTLALVETLHTEVDGEPYHIPIDAVVTTLPLTESDLARDSIDYVDPRDVLAMRAREDDADATAATEAAPRAAERPEPRTVSLVHLGTLFGLVGRPRRFDAPERRPLRRMHMREHEHRGDARTDGTPHHRVAHDWRPPERAPGRFTATPGPLGLVVERHGKTVCLAVDGLVGLDEVVVKQVASPTGSLPFVAGATVQGDGRVGLILDVPAVIGADLRATGRLSARA